MCLDSNKCLHFSSHISSKRGPQLKSVTNIVISNTANEASKKGTRKKLSLKDWRAKKARSKSRGSGDHGITPRESVSSVTHRAGRLLKFLWLWCWSEISLSSRVLSTSNAQHSLYSYTHSEKHSGAGMQTPRGKHPIGNITINIGLLDFGKIVITTILVNTYFAIRLKARTQSHLENS